MWQGTNDEDHATSRHEGKACKKYPKQMKFWIENDNVQNLFAY